MKYEWVQTGDGRQVYRKIDTQERARSDLPRPMIISDHIDEVQSMADGRTYSSKAALRATYKASGNPDGVNYVELGNEKLSPPPIKNVGSVKDSIVKAKQRLGI